MGANNTSSRATKTILKRIVMTIVFYSNFLNHHQVPVADELYRITNHNYYFVEVMPMPDSIKSIGYPDFSDKPYLIQTWKSKKSYEHALILARSANVAVFGGEVVLEFMKERLKKKRLSFLYSERRFKRGWINLFSPHLLLFTLYYHVFFRKRPFYLLCSGAYAARDYNILGMFIGKCYKWGYFTQVGNFDFGKYKDIAKSERTNIMWCARFLAWKHPELPIMLAERLKGMGCDFIINMFGDGKVRKKTEAMAKRRMVDDVVQFHGNLPNNEILKEMRKHDIFLFTSDRNEGWGAVVNESMSNGCVLVASDAIGSVPYLIKDGVTGCSFKSCDIDSLEEKVLWLIKHPDKRKEIAMNGLKNMQNEWAPQIAAKNFIQLVNNLANNNLNNLPSGPCSVAKPI